MSCYSGSSLLKTGRSANGSWGSELILNNDSETQVAKFARNSFGWQSLGNHFCDFRVIWEGQGTTCEEWQWRLKLCAA
ncbi:hypothetical protein WG66_003473 [Moniliophthora roreri]|nr:hypothetical protein WG66_003473 [Moniliophthora roreri]